MFFKKLASRFLSPAAAPEVVAAVAAFGKHPAWDDHIDDIGLQTDLLVATKRVLYVEGIGGNIDAGTWDHLPEGHALPEFDHVFVWRVRSETVVGRLWSSRDGKGRTRYPMVICAQVARHPAGWLVRSGLPVLARAKEACIKAATVQEVHAAVDRARAELSDAVHAAPAAPVDEGAPRRAAAHLAAHPEMGPDGLGLFRIIYRIERELTAYRPVTGSTARTRGVDLRPQNLRVPSCTTDPVEGAALWLNFLSGQLVPTAQVFLILPVNQPWADVIVGEPDKAQFACLRATERAIPCTSEIPYNLEADYIEHARKTLQSTGS